MSKQTIQGVQVKVLHRLDDTHPRVLFEDNNNVYELPATIVEGVNANNKGIYVKWNGNYYFVSEYTLKNKNLNYYARDNINNYQTITNLSQETISDISDIEILPDASFAFQDCEKLNEISPIIIDTWDTSNITSMRGMFLGCKNLKNLDVSSFDTSKTTNMAQMFAECESLESIDVSNFDTSHVTTFTGTFRDCKKLRSVDVSNWDTSSLTMIAQMFIGCKSLQSINLSNFDTSNVNSLFGLFSECDNLRTITLGNNWNTSKVQDMGCFMDHSPLVRQINLSTFDWSNVTRMEVAFCGCTGLEEINTTFNFTNKLTNMTNVFDGCSNLRSLDLSHCSGVVLEGDIDSTFLSCSSLTTLNLSGFDFSNLTSMLGTFADCRNLSNLILQTDNGLTKTRNVQRMYNAFGFTESLPSTFPYVIDCSGMRMFTKQERGFDENFDPPLMELHPLGRIFEYSNVENVDLYGLSGELRSYIANDPYILAEDHLVNVNFVD